MVTTSSAGLAKYAALSPQSPWPPQGHSLEKGGIAEGTFPPSLHGAPKTHPVGLASEKLHKGAQQRQQVTICLSLTTRHQEMPTLKGSSGGCGLLPQVLLWFLSWMVRQD